MLTGKSRFCEEEGRAFGGAAASLAVFFNYSAARRAAMIWSAVRPVSSAM
jgi:hypothetical protein